MWASRHYARKPFPSEWRVDAAPSTIHDLESFQQWPARTVKIQDVVAQFGIPDRYLVTTRPEKPNFLIYDLPSGHAVAFYVTQPPRDQFSAGVIIDARGKLLRLIK